MRFIHYIHNKPTLKTQDKWLKIIWITVLTIFILGLVIPETIIGGF